MAEQPIYADNTPTPEAVEQMFEMSAAFFAHVLHVGYKLVNTPGEENAALIEELTANGRSWEEAIKTGLRANGNAALNALVMAVDKAEKPKA